MQGANDHLVKNVLSDNAGYYDKKNMFALRLRQQAQISGVPVPPAMTQGVGDLPLTMRQLPRIPGADQKPPMEGVLTMIGEKLDKQTTHLEKIATHTGASAKADTTKVGNTRRDLLAQNQSDSMNSLLKGQH